MASQVIDQSALNEIRPDDRMKFALSVIGGTLAGAGVFGMLVGCLLGLFLGPILAVISGLPVFLVTVLAAWSRLLPRYYAVPAILCGALTGFLASGAASMSGDDEFATILATAMGGAGSAIAGIAFIRTSTAGRRIREAALTSGTAVSLGQIVLHLAIVGLLGACLYRAVDSFQANQRRAEQERTERQSRPWNLRD